MKLREARGGLHTLSGGKKGDHSGIYFSPLYSLQNGTVRPESVQGSDEGAPALRLRLLCPHSLVPALIGKVGAAAAGGGGWVAGGRRLGRGAALCLLLGCRALPASRTCGCTAFCPLQKGDNVKRICRDTGAAISVAEPVHGCDERVVHITGERWVTAWCWGASAAVAHEAKTAAGPAAPTFSTVLVPHGCWCVPTWRRCGMHGSRGHCVPAPHPALASGIRTPRPPQRG